MRNNQLKALIILICSMTSPLFSQIQPFRYITARIHQKRGYDIWVVSPIQESKFKKNGSITEIQFRLVGANDWKIFEIDKIDRIEYELSAQPEACVLPTPTPTPTPDKAPIAAVGTWLGTYRNSHGDTGPTTLVVASNTNGIYGTLDGDQFKNAIWDGQTLRWSYVSPSNGVTYHCEFRLSGQNSGRLNYTAVGSTTYTGSVENYVRQ